VIAGEAADLLTFRIGPARAALPLSIVREVVQAPAIVEVPGSHSQVAGVTLRAGVAVPVYDLLIHTPLWARPEEMAVAPGRRSSAQHLIVCGFGEVLVGLLGEQTDFLEGSAPPETTTRSETIRPEYLRGHLRSGAEEVALLDPAKLFASLGVPDGGRPPATEDEGEEDPAGR